MLFPKGSRANTHACEAKGCMWATEPRLPMCANHWLRVPSRIQADVWNAYRAMPQRTPTRDELMSDLDYVSAVADAIEHLAAADGRDPANRYRVAAGLIAVAAADEMATA